MDDDDELDRLLRGLELPGVEDDPGRWERPLRLDEIGEWGLE